MISVILYGRNDQHGYQYHKRVAISLNSLAEILTDAQDEILFVDYNTPDDLPTLAESIQDTLTSKAKSLLKILRVRPEHHDARFATVTVLQVLEAFARNVAIRLSNPANRWILSTNADMVFVTQQEHQSLTSLVTHLPDGFYVLPRYELPEYWWESQFIRDQPEYNIALLRQYAKALHLHTVIRQPSCIEYDNVGDFQLMLRKDIFNLGGFNEDMVLGWHIDSNLSKRMSFIYPNIETLSDQLFGYHCNHTRAQTFLHSRYRLENSWNEFVETVNSPIANINKLWGMPEVEVEEIYLRDKRSPGYHYVEALNQVQSRFLPRDYESIIHTDHFNKLFYSSPQIFSYLVDHLASMNKKTNIVYAGNNYVLFNMLVKFTQKMGFLNKMFFVDTVNKVHSQRNTVYIFDFGFDENDSTCKNQALHENRKMLKNVMQIFLKTVREEENKKYKNKLIGINVLYTDFRAIFRTKVLTGITSHNTNISYGYVNAAPGSQITLRMRIKYFYLRNKGYFFQHFHYVIVRYFFAYSDKIRKCFISSPMAKYFIKS